MGDIFKCMTPLPSSVTYNIQDLMKYGHWGTPFVQNILSRADRVVEIGCWEGHSSVAFAKLSNHNAQIICIDPWVGEEARYVQFLSNCMQNEVAEKIIPVRMMSVQFASVFNGTYDMIYIDGDHSEAAVYADLNAWFPKRKDQTSLVCGDDWTLFTNGHDHNHEEFHSPTEKTYTNELLEEDKHYILRRAVKRFAKEQGIQTIKTFGRLWWFET